MKKRFEVWQKFSHLFLRFQAKHWLILFIPPLVGCTSLPTFVPDLALRVNAPVLLDGAHGPLTAEQSKAILNRLSSSNKNTGIFDRHLALEEAISGSPLTIGNKVRLLQNGPATYKAMLDAIMTAKDHINMETYILDDDEVGQHFAQAMIDKQRQGVQVNLIRDSVGTLNTPTAFFQRMSDSGINVLEFNPINPLLARKEWALNQRDHRKLLIVDGRIAFLGGINISSVYSGSSLRRNKRTQSENSVEWRDTDLQLEGPVVAEFQKLFMTTWENQKGIALPDKKYFPQLKNVGKQVVRAIGSSPDEPYSLIYATLLSAINSAESSIRITNAYFAPDPQLLTALESAAQRGVDVTLILPSQTDSWLVFHTGRGYYERLLRAGVKIHERQGVILHSKTALVDGVWATVGSTNLDWRSFLHNYEINAVVLGDEFGSQVQVMFSRDLTASVEIKLDQWMDRPLNLKVKELLARVWEYWL